MSHVFDSTAGVNAVQIPLHGAWRIELLNPRLVDGPALRFDIELKSDNTTLMSVKGFVVRRGRISAPAYKSGGKYYNVLALTPNFEEGVKVDLRREWAALFPEVQFP